MYKRQLKDTLLFHYELPQVFLPSRHLLYDSLLQGFPDLLPEEIHPGQDTEMCIRDSVNIAKAGYFSSDRTIEEYNRDIWKLSDAIKV